MNIYLIGDSHTGCVRSTENRNKPIPPFKFIDIASTAFKLNTNRVGNTMKRNIDNIYLLWFGEIDVRLHFHKKQITMEKFINNSISSYRDTLIALKLPKNFGIISIPPPSVERNDTKVKLYYEFNNELNKMANELGINFIDIYTLTVDKDGMLQQKYRCDGVHYSNKVVPLLEKTIMEAFS